MREVKTIAFQEAAGACSDFPVTATFHNSLMMQLASIHRFHTVLLGAGLAFCLLLGAGCGGSSRPAPGPVGPLPPLSVEEWKTLPVEEKYDEATFDRLREEDPKLKKQREWDKFMRSVIIPERNKDIPRG